MLIRNPHTLAMSVHPSVIIIAVFPYSLVDHNIQNTVS